MVNEIVGTILQLLVFSLIPFIVYLAKKRTARGFFEWIGLTRPTAKSCALAVVCCLVIGGPTILLVTFDAGLREIMLEPQSMTGKIHAMGFSAQAVLMVLVLAVFKTALSEEIFFRGFVAKRLINVMGFQKGNILQAALFAALHTVLFATITSNVVFLALIFVLPFIGAYLFVYLNEKLANGSIVPGWIAHALGNVLAYSVVGFLV